MQLNWYVTKYLFNDKEIIDNKKNYEKSKKTIKETKKQIIILKNKIKELLKKGYVDVSQVKEWYEKRYGNKPWQYAYDGKNYRDVKYSLRVNDDKTIKEISKEIILYYKLKNTTPEKVVESVGWYFTKKKNWTYEYDTKQFGKIEYWEKAEKSAITRKGDCDDLAILMHNIIYYCFKELSMEEEYWRIKLTAGGTLLSGHCFNIWLHNDGEWYVIESTMDLIGSIKKTWLKTPIKNNNLYTRFYGFSRKDKSWKGTVDSIKPYELKKE